MTDQKEAQKKEAPKKEKKKPKAKGPIRFEAIIPIAIVFTLIWAYATFLLDGHARRGLEFGLSKIYGAQVDIQSVNISFRDPSLTISGIEMTNKENPIQNLVAIGKIRFVMVWDALLRAKVLINEASLNDLALYSTRKSKGEVYPPPPPEPNQGPSLTDKISERMKAEAEAQLKNNVFGDIAKIMDGGDATAQLKQIQDQLTSETKIKELQSSLTTKKDEWTKRVNELPKADEIKAIVDRVKTTKINTSNPAEAKNQLESLKKELDKVNAIIATYKKGQADLEREASGFNDSLKQIDEAVRKDIEDLQNRFKLPSIDKDSLTKALLTQIMGDKLTKLMGYVDKAKSYMPEDKAEKSEDKPDFVPHPRSKGRTYKFPVTTGYPLVWLQKAEISSKATPEGFSGDFDGQILDVTTDPAMINKPAKLEVRGSAPKMELKDIALNLVMDYRGNQGVTTLDFGVGSHPFPEQSFTKSADMTLGIAQSTASMKAHAVYTAGKIEAKIDEVVEKPNFITDAKAPILKEALTDVINKITRLGMQIHVTGNIGDPKIGLESNLGKDLAAGFETYLKRKIDEARAKLKAFVDDRIKAERAKLNAEVAKLQGTLTETLKSKENELKAQQAELQKAYKEKGEAGANKAKEDLKNKANEALKKLKL